MDTLRPIFRCGNNNKNNKYTKKKMHMEKLICGYKSLYIVFQIGVEYL